MNKYLLESLYKWPKPFISGTDLMALLDKSPDSRYGIIKRALKEGYLISLKRDLYLIHSRIDKTLPDTFELAQLIYGPSYISMESALSAHGWIPEAVITITSATCKSSKDFETPIGIFSYKKIPLSIFPRGVSQQRREDSIVMMADPWKALADYMFIKKKYWKSQKNLYEDLRIEPEILKDSDIDLLTDLITNYPNLHVRNSLIALKKGFLS